MTITDQIKILDGKIMQNEAQYNLDRKAAKISALSSNNFDKYEYLTGEDLDLEPSSIEQGKFEYSPLGKIFNKGFEKEEEKEENKKVGLRRLKNIEDKNENQLKVLKDQLEKQPIIARSKVLILTKYLLEIYLMISHWKPLMKSEIKMKLLITHGLILLVHLKTYF